MIWNSSPVDALAPVDVPLITVIGRHGAAYTCPDLAAVDRHILSLRDRIAQAMPRSPQLASHFRDDIDVLLDHRLRLELEQAIGRPDPGS